jgi:hypothetical protein
MAEELDDAEETQSENNDNDEKSVSQGGKRKKIVRRSTVKKASKGKRPSAASDPPPPANDANDLVPPETSTTADPTAPRPSVAPNDNLSASTVPRPPEAEVALPPVHKVANPTQPPPTSSPRGPSNTITNHTSQTGEGSTPSRSHTPLSDPDIPPASPNAMDLDDVFSSNFQQSPPPDDQQSRRHDDFVEGSSGGLKRFERTPSKEERPTKRFLRVETPADFWKGRADNTTGFSALAKITSSKGGRVGKKGKSKAK